MSLENAERIHGGAGQTNQSKPRSTPLIRPLQVGAKVWLNDGTSQIITQIINEEAIGDNLFYRWSLHGEIEHAAMDFNKHSILMVNWPNA